jgi:type I restriction enzyme S subunit
LPWFRGIAADKATTMGHIQRKHLTEARIVVPPVEIMISAQQVFQPLFDRMLVNDLQNRTLSELRDLLLPRLLSGELRVAEAEAMVP